MKNKEIGGICDYDFFMRYKCKNCPLKKRCDEYERNKLSNTKDTKSTNKQPREKASDKSKQDKKLSNDGF